jgi:DNA polymerase IV
MRANSFVANPNSVVMYVDMNSFFASCEQQDNEELRGKPVGVCPFASPHAAVIAPSVEAKRYGVKTGMRLHECRALCPDIIPVSARPHRYRWYHIEIMKVLHSYCDDVMAKSIDEAVINLTSYRLVYKDLKALAVRIKEDIRQACGEVIKCSIGIAPNSFLAKLGTELQKPDGLVQLTPENIDEHLKRLKLTDLPGIAKANEKRLHMIGIKNPYEMRHASPAILRKAFGGIVGHYWHCRLNFMEVDLYENDYRAMSATRSVSRVQRESKQALEGLFISLCTRLEQRMVKQGVFCREVSFFIKYQDLTRWDTHIRFTYPVQDAMDLRHYIEDKMTEFEQAHRTEMFNRQTEHIGVVVSKFIKSEQVSYTLFDNKMKQDKLRLVMYHIKDRYGKDIVRKACETVAPNEFKDAIGFGSVKDMYGSLVDKSGNTHKEVINKYLLEE